MKKLAKKIVLFAIVLLSIAGCRQQSNHENQENNDDKVRIILDADFGSSTDDLFVLQMMYKYADQGKCEILGVMVDREGEDNAAVVDVMNNYFGYPDVPIGLVRNGIDNPMVWIDYADMVYLTNEDGTPMFKRTYSDYSSLPDGWQLYRKILSEQPDKSVEICSIGFLTCLSQLLESEPDEYSSLNGVDLVKAKVKRIYLMGGVFGTAIEPDYNFAQGIDFSLKFFKKWPHEVDMYFSPGEVGDIVEYPAEMVINDIDWTDIHPIKQVYMNYNCNTGQKMWDPMALIPIVEGDHLFIMSERGNVVLTENAETLFTPSIDGNCFYQIPGDAAWAEEMLNKIRTLLKVRQ